VILQGSFYLIIEFGCIVDFKTKGILFGFLIRIHGSLNSEFIVYCWFIQWLLTTTCIVWLNGRLKSLRR